MPLLFLPGPPGAGWLVWRGGNSRDKGGNRRNKGAISQGGRCWTLWGNVYTPRDDDGSDKARELTSGHRT
eukprot:scaffold58790_cov65-Phaeocystis_antarctica.AAC.2